MTKANVSLLLNPDSRKGRWCLNIGSPFMFGSRRNYRDIVDQCVPDARFGSVGSQPES